MSVVTTERTRKPTTTTLPPIVPLALIVGVSPFATDMYIPALPQIAHDLGTTPGAVQLSLTAFLVAFAVGQLLVGPVSDGVGRRPMLVVGTAVFALASVGCALAPDVVTLVLARIAQGLGGAAGAVAGRAMVSDVASGTRMAKVFGTLAAINAIGPVVAPLAGGAVLTFGTWRIMFVVLAVLGALFFAMVVLRFRETLPPERRGGVGFAANGRRIRELLAIPRFRAYVLSGVLSTVGFFAYIATSSFVFQTQFGFSEGMYTLVFATNASMMIVTTLVFGRVVGRFSEDSLLTVGLLVGTAGAAAVLVSALLDLGPVPVWCALAVVTGAWGFVLPAAMTRTQHVGAAHPGTAAALQGGLTFGIGGLGTPLAGALGGTALAMGGVMAALMAAAVVVQVTATRRDRSGT
ncbi:DHA1 family bicyclomycin/chloramphenicol resistance-like MFS transporter [Curtobacterium sp. PhB128]|nr:DHA1 family bicyclomycin/chloramphenicol resistance-like MFS transporter [Curtobacterium sp. PhB78]TCL81155.1 DHA1 family bicyclomycin/chloramphenicol resistance-like MFS transporter [Curtobacterium sp. PhB128]TCL99280.1 DHA1 family bicyclomycin/chloramphenicol resistance-like MFS transporter [Curtobacterium sp. PhB138]TCU45400.1 DHA1 family bicyclomycin/chloramphenicol resistance-like MFS transporter [Curtobacterium sp. PhB146]TDW53220.1 DHA1 family bicyclomycin/chloramphenicol resistance-l